MVDAHLFDTDVLIDAGRRELEAIDALIAATAIVDGRPFILKNQRDYRFIDTLDLLPYPDPFSQAE